MVAPIPSLCFPWSNDFSALFTSSLLFLVDKLMLSFSDVSIDAISRSSCLPITPPPLTLFPAHSSGFDVYSQCFGSLSLRLSSIMLLWHASFNPPKRVLTVLYKSNFCPVKSDNCNQSGIQNPSIWGAYCKIPRHSFWDMATLTYFFWQPWKMKFRFQGFWP